MQIRKPKNNENPFYTINGFLVGKNQILLLYMPKIHFIVYRITKL
jgi:hypothetical protein